MLVVSDLLRKYYVSVINSGLDLKLSLLTLQIRSTYILPIGSFSYSYR